MKTPRPPASRKTRPNQSLPPAEFDAYRQHEKLPAGTTCPDCGAIFADGRWQWLATGKSGAHQRCPACLRIRDQFPAGYVTLSGPFLVQHRSDIFDAIRNLESKEKHEHPLQRIMNTVDEKESVQITTTDSHLARAIGTALHRAHGGELEVKFSEQDNVARVTWHR
jgi:NMD protein affecting ribosome stability and mRNA decay